ncbi:hypothetical protein [Pseudomonas sp. B21-048]|uniref:hypothetical protein n=1 Tax=Pseudomonas sp. B21-048 TaxID=2895490 RepID=UPI00215EACF6|nr:hypothetical protein [Pseudomonas sp. B21-048]UVK99242.1 hypothetical protein LOY56_02175 [Pseudomonas sp. B21-048]
MRIIVKVGLLPTKKGEGLMIAAKNKQITAISNLCLTVNRVVSFQKTLHAAFRTPIKDKP